MLTVGSLFAGIGGFDLGLERAGMQVKWQVEIDPYCLKVLEKHWPHVRRYNDIKTVGWSGIEPVDLGCGGFPCQPVSVAGKRKGTVDKRWLWPEFVRCLGVLRPRYVLIENVPGLLTANDGLAFAEVLRDMAACGYDAEWDCIPACAVNAPHYRDRLWVVAYSKQNGWGRNALWPILGKMVLTENRASTQRATETVGIINRSQGLAARQHSVQPRRNDETDCAAMADSIIEQRNGRLYWTCGWEREPQEALRDARRGGRQETWLSIPESLLGRVADGIPHRVDRLRGP